MKRRTTLTLSQPEDKARLLGLIDEIEQAIAKRDEINATLREIYALAEGEGYEKRAIQEVIKARKLDRDTLHTTEQARDAYFLYCGLADEEFRTGC